MKQRFLWNSLWKDLFDAIAIVSQIVIVESTPRIKSGKAVYSYSGCLLWLSWNVIKSQEIETFRVFKEQITWLLEVKSDYI